LTNTFTWAKFKATIRSLAAIDPNFNLIFVFYVSGVPKTSYSVTSNFRHLVPIELI